MCRSLRRRRSARSASGGTCSRLESCCSASTRCFRIGYRRRNDGRILRGTMLDFLRSASTPPRDLLGIIRYVRARWRARLAVKGAVRVIVANVAVFFALAYLMQWARFTPASILTSRLALAAAIVISIYFFLVKPLRRRVSDDQVALYLEEKEPSLQTMLISAVESSREGRHWESSALVQRLVEQAVEKCSLADAPRRAEHGPLRANGAIFASVVTAAILAVLLGPAFFRHALSAVLI